MDTLVLHEASEAEVCPFLFGMYMQNARADERNQHFRAYALRRKRQKLTAAVFAGGSAGVGVWWRLDAIPVLVKGRPYALHRHGLAGGGGLLPHYHIKRQCR